MGSLPGPVYIWTDGSSGQLPNEPGGWAAILIYENTRREISGASLSTTNQRMEITAVIRALRALKEPCIVHLYSDSSYVINCMRRRWIDRWSQNGWKNSNRRPVANRDLWEQLKAESQRHLVKWVKVKGHASGKFPENDRADELAKAARLQLLESLKEPEAS